MSVIVENDGAVGGAIDGAIKGYDNNTYAKPARHNTYWGKKKEL